MNSDQPIEKRNVTEGPADMKNESTTKLNRKSDGSLEQVQVDQLATCPNCDAPIEDFSEELLGTCAIQGCETYLCENCGAVAECGKVLCRSHTQVIPDQNPGHEDSTIIACPDHASVIWESQNLIRLASLWRKKRELDVRKKEIKTEQVKALVPIYVQRMKGEVEERKLKLKAYEIRKHSQIEQLKADIERESNRIKAEQIRSNERMKKEEIKAQLVDTARKREENLYKLNLLELREQRKQEELDHRKKKEGAQLNLAEEELARKKNKDRSQIQLAQEKLEADKRQAKRKTQAEVMDMIRKHTENMEEISVEKSKEKRKSVRLAHDIEKDNRELSLEEEKMKSARELAEKKLGVRAAELKQKAIKDIGELNIKEKAEQRKSEALKYQKKKDALQLMLEGEKVQLSADELAHERQKADREFKKELLKMQLEKRMHDEDVRARLKEQADKRENQKAQRMLDAAELVRKENKDLRDYYLRVEKLNRARKKLYSR